MIKVITDKGTTVHVTEPGTKTMLTKETAEALAGAANRRAEKLGVETRYSVVGA